MTAQSGSMLMRLRKDFMLKGCVKLVDYIGIVLVKVRPLSPISVSFAYYLTCQVIFIPRLFVNYGLKLPVFTQLNNTLFTPLINWLSTYSTVPNKETKLRINYL